MSDHRPVLLLATTNAGKRREFARLLPPIVTLLSLADLPVAMPNECGTSFAATAAAKALAAADQTGLLVLADDSGLEVDALNGAPGVRSARYAGEPASDARNREALLAALAGVPSPFRAARFQCAVAVARPGTIVATAVGSCEGEIADVPSGTLGFGYDPIFRLPDGRTMAELTADEKNGISHRAAAYTAVLPWLLQELGIVAQEASRS